MPIEINTVIIFSAGGVIGFLVRTFIDHFLAKSRDKESIAIKEFNIAAEKFRNVFYTELEGLYPTPINWDKYNININAFLHSKFTKLDRAVDEFRRYLPEGERTAFTNTWVAYYSANGDERYECYDRYTAFGSNPTYKENFKKNVEQLLKYARQI